MLKASQRNIIWGTLTTSKWNNTQGTLIASQRVLIAQRQQKDKATAKPQTSLNKTYITDTSKLSISINRSDATYRKLDIQQKDQLVAVQKDIIRMLRAIVHFRDHMLACIEKENLMDQAEALVALSDLAKDKVYFIWNWFTFLLLTLREETRRV